MTDLDERAVEAAAKAIHAQLGNEEWPNVEGHREHWESLARAGVAAYLAARGPVEGDERAWRNGWGSVLNALRAADNIASNANVPSEHHQAANETIRTLVSTWIDSIESLTENFVDAARRIGFASELRGPASLEQAPDAVLAGTCECDLGECTCPPASPEQTEGRDRMPVFTIKAKDDLALHAEVSAPASHVERVLEAVHQTLNEHGAPTHDKGGAKLNANGRLVDFLAGYEMPPMPAVRAWLQREGQPQREMTEGFRVEPDGRVVFPLALQGYEAMGEQAILTVQFSREVSAPAEPTEALSEEQMSRIAEILRDPEEAEKLLPRAEREAIQHAIRSLRNIHHIEVRQVGAGYLAARAALSESPREGSAEPTGRELKLREALAWLIGAVESIESASSGRFGVDLTFPRAALSGSPVAAKSEEASGE
jgi:hypothetical protein